MYPEAGFHNSFDRISHNYLFRILQQYGTRQCSIERLCAIYSDANASVQNNDTFAGTIPIQCGVRQVCPLNMALYALCLHPLLCALDHNLQGLGVGRRNRCRLVFAYADDVTVFVTNPGKFATIRCVVNSSRTEFFALVRSVVTTQVLFARYRGLVC